MHKAEFHKNLFNWYSQNNRDFPWRHTDDSYKILITEILLQRTRAEKVREVYDQFFSSFPDIYSLSKANSNDIKIIVEPLGLKKRAAYLTKLTQHLQEYCGLKIPEEKDKLLKIKGIGFYTANAVICFAFGERQAIVDWNIARVLNRIWNIDISISPHTNKEVMAFAQQLLPKKNPKEYNWALLDFAALVCKPRKPDCCNCPMKNFCIYYKNKSAAQNKTR